MRIAFNGLFLTRPNTGMGQYSLGLLRALPKAVPKAEIVAFVPGPVQAKLPARVKVIEVPPKRRWLGRGLSLNDWELRQMPRAVADHEPDLFHTPYPSPLPPFRIPTVMTVHDMIPWQLPYYRRAFRSRVKQKKILEGIRQASRIVTVSEASADDIVSVAQVPRELITVAYESVSGAFAKRPAAAAITKAKRSHGLSRPYVFYIGGFDYRKNVRGLIEAFGWSGLAETHDLVLGGTVTAPSSALYADYHRLAILLRQSNIQPQTRLLGQLDEADKAAVIAGADAFAYPTLAEGFGLPILEALAVGTPVVTSSLPVTKELFAGAVTTANPYDPEDLGVTLRKVIDRPPAAMVKRGRSLAQLTYTWPKAARQTAEAYRRAAEGVF